MKLRPFANLLLIAGVATAGISDPALALWLYQKSESAFDDQTSHIAISPSGDAALSVRCNGSKTEVVYIVMNAGMTEETAAMANSNAGLVKLKLRVDKGEINEIPVISSVKEGSYIVVADIETSFAEQIRDAKKSVAATVSLAGNNFYENSFSASGSTDAVGKALSLCATDAASN